MKTRDDGPGSTPSTCATCGSSDLERLTLGAAQGWWCRACDDLWADRARLPHAFDPMTFSGPDGPGVADWCGVIGCAKPAADPVHDVGRHPPPPTTREGEPMAAAGDTYSPSVVRAGCDTSTTGAYLIVDGDDRNAAAGPAGHPDPGDPTLWDAPPLELTGPGEWSCTWTFTGAGAGTVRQVFTVDTDAAAPPTGFSYATTGDYVRYSGQSVPAGLRRSLIAASTEIDRITVAARYPLDLDGRPADPQLRQALADATCELVDWWAETGLETGGRHLYTSASIAGVSIGWGGANTSNPQADRVGPKVWSMLMRAGLLTPGGILTDG